MKKVMSVYAQNLAYYNEGEIIGGWLDLPTTKEEIDDYLSEVVRIDEEHEEYEIADIDDCPFEYEIIQWADLHKLNNLAIIYSSLDEKELEMVNAYCENIESNLGIDEIINICLQTDRIPYYEYDSQFNGYGSNEEKMGLTIANETGLLDTLQKLGVQDYFDFERYGEEFGFDYQLLDNGYLEYTDLDKKLYSKEEIEEIANNILIKDKYDKKEKVILEKIADVKERFRKLTQNNRQLIQHFKGDTRFTNVMVAGTILAGIELRNLQRENKNLEGELERSPFSSEMEELIDEYAKLEKELEEIENDYEMERD